MFKHLIINTFLLTLPLLSDDVQIQSLLNGQYQDESIKDLIIRIQCSKDTKTNNFSVEIIDSRSQITKQTHQGYQNQNNQVEINLKTDDTTVQTMKGKQVHDKKSQLELQDEFGNIIKWIKHLKFPKIDGVYHLLDQDQRSMVVQTGEQQEHLNVDIQDHELEQVTNQNGMISYTDGSMQLRKKGMNVSSIDNIYQNKERSKDKTKDLNIFQTLQAEKNCDEQRGVYDIESSMIIKFDDGRQWVRVLAFADE